MKREIPVINSGGVGLWAIKDIGSDPSGGEVAAGVEHAPPHVVLTRRRRGRRSGRSRRPWSCRHRQRPLVLATTLSDV